MVIIGAFYLTKTHKASNLTKSTIDKLHRLQSVQDTLRQFMQSYGYVHLAVPILEPAELFLTRAGNQIIDEMIAFKHKSKQYALRPEFTASAANLYIGNHSDESVRWQFSGQIYRDTEQDKLQQNSSGAEYIGEASYVADAEIIAIAIKGLEKLGIANLEVTIGHVGLLLHLLERFALDSRTRRLLLSERKDAQKLARLTQHLVNQSSDSTDQLSQIESDSIATQQMLDTLLDSTRYGTTMGGRQSVEIAGRLIEKHIRETNKQQVLDAAEFLTKWHQISGEITSTFGAIERIIGDDAKGKEILASWHKLVDMLSLYDVPKENIRIQADLAQDWEYYTGITFTIQANGKLLAGGGRYDELISVIGKNDSPVPAVGFAYYLGEILDHVASDVLTYDKPVIVSYDDNYADALHWSDHLRAQGIHNALLPISRIGTESKVVHIIDANTATFNKSTYHLENLANLITELRDTSQ